MKKNHTEIGTRWTTINYYVDENTGEEITRNNAKKYYIILKKDKYVEFNRNKTQGIVHITNICTKEGRQLRLGE